MKYVERGLQVLVDHGVFEILRIIEFVILCVPMAIVAFVVGFIDSFRRNDGWIP